MDVHKPKPWHGLREFLKEYGIIVLGVLTALAFEQAAEWLHWRHVVHESRTALDAGVEDAYGSMMSRMEMQDCVEARLADIAIVLQRHDAGQPLGIVAPVGHPTASVADGGSFEMALADGSMSHMGIRRKQHYFAATGAYRVFTDATRVEREAWETLDGLDRASTLTAQDWADMHKAEGKASSVSEMLKADMRSDYDGAWLYPYRDLPRPKNSGLRSLPTVRQLCRPMIARR